MPSSAPPDLEFSTALYRRNTLGLACVIYAHTLGCYPEMRSLRRYLDGLARSPARKWQDMGERAPEERGCSRLLKRGRTPFLFFQTGTIDHRTATAPYNHGSRI